MKKNLIILASSLLLIGTMASCQKEYTCVCTPKDGTTASTSFLTKKTTKSEAKEVCEAGIPNNTCTLD